MFDNHTDFESCIIIYLSIQIYLWFDRNYKNTNIQMTDITDLHMINSSCLQFRLHTVHCNLHTSQQTTALHTFHNSFIFGQRVFFLQCSFTPTIPTPTKLHTLYVNTYIKINILTKIAQVEYNIYTLQYFILP